MNTEITTMETCMKNMVERLRFNIAEDMYNEQFGHNVTLLVLAAYNRYQEEERDGVDYLFNISNKEDLKCCIEGGMKASEIAWLFNECTKTANSTPFFFFGCNHEQPETIETWDALKRYLQNFLDSIIMYMLAYHDSAGYKQLYDQYISEYLTNHILL